jgi:hypothetical protein
MATARKKLKDGKQTTTWARLSMKDGKLIHPIEGSNGKVYEELTKTDSKETLRRIVSSATAASPATLMRVGSIAKMGLNWVMNDDSLFTGANVSPDG